MWSKNDVRKPYFLQSFSGKVNLMGLGFESVLTAVKLKCKAMINHTVYPVTIDKNSVVAVQTRVVYIS